jgi:hypothetical protein
MNTRRPGFNRCSPALLMHISTGIEDEGIKFFFTNYINNVSRDAKSGKVNPSQVPLWDAMNKSFSLCTAVSSVGFAGLSNVRKSKSHMIVARKKYAIALQETAIKLKDASEADLETACQAAMILAAFEVSVKKKSKTFKERH